MLGERSGNNNFLIDGQSNKDTVNGGPAQQFNQETIAEFQVLTSGYKAEFGQASGAIVNVITKSGSNLLTRRRLAVLQGRCARCVEFAGPDENGAAAASPLRLEPGARRSAGQGQDVLLRLGGAHQRESPAGFQVSGYRQRRRQPAASHAGSAVRCADARSRRRGRSSKFDERLGKHQLSEQVNFTDGGARSFLPLSSANSLPSARNDTDTTRLLVGIGDTALLGNPGNPYVVTLRGAIRREDSETHPVTDGSDRVNALQSL